MAKFVRPIPGAGQSHFFPANFGASSLTLDPSAYLVHQPTASNQKPNARCFGQRGPCSEFPSPLNQDWSSRQPCFQPAKIKCRQGFAGLCYGVNLASLHRHGESFVSLKSMRRRPLLGLAIVLVPFLGTTLSSFIQYSENTPWSGTLRPRLRILSEVALFWIIASVGLCIILTSSRIVYVRRGDEMRPAVSFGSRDDLPTVAERGMELHRRLALISLQLLIHTSLGLVFQAFSCTLFRMSMTKYRKKVWLVAMERVMFLANTDWWPSSPCLPLRQSQYLSLWSHLRFIW